MIYNEGAEMWVECDNEGFTQFAGFDTSKRDIVSSMGRWGWTFKDGKVLCPYCSEAAGLIAAHDNMFNNRR